METWRIILAIASFGIAGTILKYCNSTRKKEGPILSQTYFGLSEEERKYFDKDKEYERLTILYGFIGLFFIFIGVSVMTLFKIFVYAAFTCLAMALIYSIIKIIEARKDL